MPSRKEWTDRLLSLINVGLEKDGNIDMRKLVAQFSLDNYKSPNTVREFIYTLNDAEKIFIDKRANRETIFRNKEEAEKTRHTIQIVLEDKDPSRNRVEEYKV